MAMGRLSKQGKHVVHVGSDQNEEKGGICAHDMRAQTSWRHQKNNVPSNQQSANIDSSQYHTMMGRSFLNDQQNDLFAANNNSHILASTPHPH